MKQTLQLSFRTIALLLMVIYSSAGIAQEKEKISIYFDPGEHEPIVMTEENICDKLNKAVVGKQILSVDVMAYTDTDGSLEYNQALSERRANRIVDLVHGCELQGKTAKSKYFGESYPILVEGNEDKGRSRRVDVFISFKEEKPSQDFAELPQFDTIRGPLGTELILKPNAFAPYDLSEVEFEFKETYRKSDMIIKQMTTQTENGECLVSDGMLEIIPTVDGAPVDPVDSVKVRIPITEANDDMSLFLDTDNDGDWEEDQEPLVMNKVEGYYEFKVPRLSLPINMDFIKQIELTRDAEDLIVKARWAKFDKAFMIHKAEMSMLDTYFVKESLKKRKIVLCDDELSYYILAHVKRKGREEVALLPFEDLKYKRLWKRYVLKKKHYKNYTEQEFRAQLEELFDYNDASLLTLESVE